MEVRRIWRGFAPYAILALAAILRLWHLDRPDELVFDELFYVRDAVSQLAHGYPTVWPDDDPEFGAERALLHSSDPSYVAHPPLGKWIIALGIIVFGAGDGWGWRGATAIAGVITVALTMWLAWRLTRTAWIAFAAGILLAVDGVHVVLSRVSLLDGPLTLLIVLGAIVMARDHEWAAHRWRAWARQSASWRAARTSEASGGGRYRTSIARGGHLGPIWVIRPWLFIAAGIFGLAAAVKWSGVYALVGFLLLTLIRDLIARPNGMGTVIQSVVSGLGAATVAVAAYLSTWLGWILTDGGWERDTGPWPATLIRWHVEMLTWHSTLEDDHPFATHPLTWPLGVRPTGMFFEDLGGGLVRAISPLPNVLVTWGGALAILALIVVIVWQGITRPRALAANRLLAASAFVLVGVLSGWVPWLLIPRTAVFQFYAVVLTPFTAIALAIVLAAISGRISLPGLNLATTSQEGRRGAVAIYLIMTVVIGLVFWPVWAGLSIPEWFRDAHLWLPGWQ